MFRKPPEQASRAVEQAARLLCHRRLRKSPAAPDQNKHNASETGWFAPFRVLTAQLRHGSFFLGLSPF